jgi:hypothetical protein
MTQELTNFFGSILIVDEFDKLVFLFDFLAAADTRQFILFLYAV